VLVQGNVAERLLAGVEGRNARFSVWKTGFFCGEGWRRAKTHSPIALVPRFPAGHQSGWAAPSCPMGAVASLIQEDAIRGLRLAGFWSDPPNRH